MGRVAACAPPQPYFLSACLLVTARRCASASKLRGGGGKGTGRRKRLRPRVRDRSFQARTAAVSSLIQADPTARSDDQACLSLYSPLQVQHPAAATRWAYAERNHHKNSRGGRVAPPRRSRTWSGARYMRGPASTGGAAAPWAGSTRPPSSAAARSFGHRTARREVVGRRRGGRPKTAVAATQSRPAPRLRGTTRRSPGGQPPAHGRARQGGRATPHRPTRLGSHLVRSAATACAPVGQSRRRSPPIPPLPFFADAHMQVTGATWP